MVAAGFHVAAPYRGARLLLSQALATIASFLGVLTLARRPNTW